MLIALVASLHLGFFLLESILWTSPHVMRLFGNTQEEAGSTRILALNQGCYNLGVALLLVHFLVTGNMSAISSILIFIIGMGLIGAITANWRIVIFQSLPAVLALLVI